MFRNGTPDSFTSHLKLIAGKILSEVEKLSESHSTFEIEAGGVVCAVRGASFEVEKQDGDVLTTTYNGSVAVQNGTNTQNVEAGEHGDYSLGQGTFLPKRPVTEEEKTHYQNWTVRMPILRQKTRNRWETLRSLDRLPSEQRERVLQQTQGASPVERLQTIRQVSQNPPNTAGQHQTNSNQPGRTSSGLARPNHQGLNQGRSLVRPQGARPQGIRSVPRNVSGQQHPRPPQARPKNLPPPKKQKN